MEKVDATITFSSLVQSLSRTTEIQFIGRRLSVWMNHHSSSSPNSNCKKCCGSKESQREQVAHYYSTVLSSNRDLKSSACCIGQQPGAHKAICSQLPDEILEKFYGCGSPIPPALKDAVVLDLGCGTGRDVYICSALVGPRGRVVGLDMLESSLQVARKYQNMLAKQFVPELEGSSNVEFLCGYMEQLEEAGVKPESCDVAYRIVSLIWCPTRNWYFDKYITH
jgi:2-polyprenyl-3-methyl-5-hydroxy-6-metoxy-1,4-benzoquinol methylase